MKKWIALFLSLVMLCMLTIPALAAGSYYEDYLADFDRWWEEEWDYDATFEEYWQYVSSDYESADELKAELYEYWLDGMPERDWKEDYLAAHPGAMDQFRANAYHYFEEHYPYYDSAEEYMEWWELTEEEFVEQMAKNQLDALYQADLERLEREEELKALGGVPGQLNVMVNGRFVTFPDAVPQIVNDRTMVPFRALIESLGGEVGFDGKVYGSLNGTDVVLVPGSSVMTVTKNGETSQVAMDCAPYIEGGRTFVPVRFVCEAFGYAVGWDGAYYAAVITDTRALADAADEQFTILNRALANQTVRPAEGQSLLSTLTGSMTCTLMDSLNGNTALDASLAAEVLQNSKSISGNGTFTLSDALIELLLTNEELDGELDQEQQAALRTALRQGDLRFILNADGRTWFRSSLLEVVDEGGGNVWCAVPANADVSSLFAQSTAAATLGQALAGSVQTDSIHGWSAAEEALEQLAAVVGDGRFTKVNGVDTLQMDAEELDPDGSLEDGELTLTVDDKGQLKLSLTAQTLSRYVGDPSIRVELEYTLSAGTAALTAQFHVANLMKLDLSLTGINSVTDQAPLSEPPAGEPVADTAIQPLN